VNDTARTEWDAFGLLRGTTTFGEGKRPKQRRLRAVALGLAIPIAAFVGFAWWQRGDVQKLAKERFWDLTFVYGALKFRNRH
jgi:hypothetical protein